jgi:hypothetical protein
MSKIYIAGKITNLQNYKQYFNEVEADLISQGHIIMNPARLGEGFPYTAYMPICLAMIEACDTICMLSNYKDSKGAQVELAYASLQGKNIIYQEEM